MYASENNKKKSYLKSFLGIGFNYEDPNKKIFSVQFSNSDATISKELPSTNGKEIDIFNMSNNNYITKNASDVEFIGERYLNEAEVRQICFQNNQRAYNGNWKLTNDELQMISDGKWLSNDYVMKFNAILRKNSSFNPPNKCKVWLD